MEGMRRVFPGEEAEMRRDVMEERLLENKDGGRTEMCFFLPDSYKIAHRFPCGPSAL